MKKIIHESAFIIAALLFAPGFTFAEEDHYVKEKKRTDFGTSGPSSITDARVNKDGMSDGSATTARALDGSMTPNSAMAEKREREARARMGQVEKSYRPPADPFHAENTRELGAFAAKVEFEPGTAFLTKESKLEIDSLVAKARTNGKLDKIRVLAWADREYPSSGEKVARTETRLADTRGDAVREYLREQLEVQNVDTYNMARRPSAVSKMMRTPETRIKTKAEELGIAPSEADAPSLFSERRRASSALVLAVMDE